jgi:hypothetical protein
MAQLSGNGVTMVKESAHRVVALSGNALKNKILGEKNVS